MPIDLNRIIDYQLYLATQRCLAPYIPRRRTSNAAPGCHRETTIVSPETHVTACDRRSSLGSLLSPWSASIGSGSGSESGVEEAVHAPVGPSSTRWGRSPGEPCVTAPVGYLAGPVGSGGIIGGFGSRDTVSETRRGEEESIYTPDGQSSTPGDHSPFGSFVTAPVSDIDAPAVSGSCDGAVVETVIGSGVTAPSNREALHIDTHFGAVGYDNLAGTVEPRTTSQTQPEDPQRSRSPNNTQPPNHLSRITAITLLVEDLPLTRRFYEQVFSVEAIHEDENSAAFLFNDGTLIVNLYVSSGAGDDILLGSGVPVGRARGAGRRFQLSVAVGDVDGVYATLRRLEEGDGEGEGKGKGRALVVEGLTEPRMRSWGVRTVTFQDPSGHCWEVAEEGG